MSTVADLDKALKAAGVPILGVGVREEAGARSVKINYAKEATDEHKAAAAEIVDKFDWNAPEPPSLEDAKVKALWCLLNGIKPPDWAAQMIEKADAGVKV